MMLKLWKWYQNCLAVHPVKTQIISSGFLWGVGDIVAQSITHAPAKNRTLHLSDCLHLPSEVGSIIKCLGDGGLAEEYSIVCCILFLSDPFGFWTVFFKLRVLTFCRNIDLEIDRDKHMMDADKEFKINWKRVAITSMFGFGFVGPVGHFWYEYLDRFIRLKLQMQPKSVRFVATKVAMDGLIFGPFDLLVFFSYMGFSNGKSASQVKEDLKRDFIPALVLEGGAWPLMQVVNFRYVPVRFQLLYVNAFCLLDSAFLSWLEQQQDASWKQWFTSFTSLNKEEREER